MHQNANVVLVSNRPPVSFAGRPDGGFDVRRGAGGLAAALDPVARELGDEAVWIAAATSADDRRALAAGAAEGLRARLGYPTHLLDFEPGLYARYYDDVSNRMLWFAAHDLWDEVGRPTFGPDAADAFEDAYETINRTFAETIAAASAPRALVLLQDYHLATTAAHLRRIAPDRVVLHFTHSSFGPPAALDPLPENVRTAVLEGMLAADVVGFHVTPWAHNFLACCVRAGARVDRGAGAVEHRGRRTWVRTYPIPIEIETLRERAAGKRASEWAERFGAPGGPLVVRADRAEPSKNIVRGFEAWGELLDRRPDLTGARFVACIYPSRTTMPEYRDYGERIETAAADVNARHPGTVELYIGDDFDRALGAYREYNVLVANSLMDGMNLVAKEGPVINRRGGALVLSRAAGSFEELGSHAVPIDDPRDVAATAAAVEEALALPAAERARRAEALRTVVMSRRPRAWIDAQLADLHAVSRGEEPPSPAPRAGR